MYQYDQFDQQLIEERVVEFRQQTRRYLEGNLNDDQFRSLRLMNGLYEEKHSPMLRVNIPYGQLSSRQLHKLASIARDYDQGFGHFTTRQNIQFNWPELNRVPDLLAELAEVQMHAIQSSGNCIRNITADHLAGITTDEVDDPRPYCELLRQWSSLHPEFAFLPRKFKIAVTGSDTDRAAIRFHDIGLQLQKDENGEIGFRVYVGGGQGRTPAIGQVIREFLPQRHLLSYFEAILRVYNLLGRRDNIYKARIKILLKSLGIKKLRELVDTEWLQIRETSLLLRESEIETMRSHFKPPVYNSYAVERAGLPEMDDRLPFARWVKQNTLSHRKAGYRIVYLSLKSNDQAPGDLTDWQMDRVADLADKYSFGQIRTTHSQNLLLPHVEEADLATLWHELQTINLHTANIGTVNDIIACPGLDYCSLANTTSIPVARQIQQRFRDLNRLYDLGDVQIKISGCMNACGHHHIGHIGILGVDKKGAEWYQLTLGGDGSETAALGQRLGPAVSKAEVVTAVERILETYVALRLPGETFLQTFNRIGLGVFADSVYQQEELVS